MGPLGEVGLEWKSILVPAGMEESARLCAQVRDDERPDSGDVRPMLDRISSLGRVPMSLSREEKEVDEEDLEGTARRTVPEFLVDLILYDDSFLLGDFTVCIGDALGMMTAGFGQCETRRQWAVGSRSEES